MPQQRHLAVHHYPSPKRTQQINLLFVHGAFTHSTYWTFNFIPYFQARGFDCFALDLSGHGASEGRDCLDTFGIDDFAQDVANALNQIQQPVVLLGHSMGALVCQRYLEHGHALAAVFMSPVPITGTSGSAAMLAARFPNYFQAMEETVSGIISDQNNDLLAQIYFTPNTRVDDILQFLPTVTRESHQAVMEMALLAARPPIRRNRIPALVVGGELDTVFPPSQLFFTALPWQAEIVRVPAAGHVLPLDNNWQFAAEAIWCWLGKCAEDIPEFD